MNDSLAPMEVFNEEIEGASVLKYWDGLRLSRDGKRVRLHGTSRSIVDRPFTGDLVSSY